MTKTITGYECRFATHVPSDYRLGTQDLHVVKEIVHYSDGTTAPNLKFIKDFKRPYYITKESKRNHRDKKEWTSIDDVLKSEVTQSDLRNSIAKALGKQWSRESLKELTLSPYVYWTDISSTAIIKKTYQDKFPDFNTPYKVATFDIETDVINGTEDPIIATIVFQDKCFVSILPDFVQGLSLIEDRIQKAANKYIGEYLTKHKMTIESYIATDVVDLINSVFKKAHEWKPDFLAIWNIDFDISRILETLKKYQVDPRDILCDPSVPKEYRVCKYKQGPKKKVTASGQVKPLNPAMQWHTLQLTASFYVIDAMCSYKHIRLSQQEESSYSLDAILQKELGIRKLKFEEADAYSGLKWHQFLQTNYKIEYIVYNIFDCLSMIELDDKTKDLKSTLPVFSGCSDFSDFKSQPKRIVDAFHYFCLDKGVVLASTGFERSKFKPWLDEDVEVVIDNEDEDNEEYTTLSLAGWVCTLPSHMSMLGLPVISEDSFIKTGIRAYVFDADAAAAYPTATSIGNVSKGTTKRELIKVDGLSEDLFRLQNMNCILGETNAAEYCTTMFNMPKPLDLLLEFQKTI